MKSEALRKQVVTNQEIEGLLAMRETFENLKKRLDLMEQSVKASEASIITKLDQGAEVQSNHNLLIATKEVRHVSWKAQFVAVEGAERAKEVLESTAPTTYRRLVIR